MDYVNLGRTGVKVSRIGLGMMAFGNPRRRSWAPGIDEGRAIVGASKVWHSEEVVKSPDVRLSEDEVKALEAPYRPKRVVDHG